MKKELSDNQSAGTAPDYAAIYIAHHESARKMLWSIAGKHRDVLSDEDIQDIEQIVWETLFTHALKNFRGECKLTTYIYNVINTRVKDYVGNIKGKQTDDFDESYQKQGSPDVIISKLVDAELIDAAREVFETLPGPQKAIFVLIGIEGMGQEETADRMKLAQSTVSEHWSNIRRRVEQELTRRYPHYQFDIEEIICRTGY